LRTFVDVVLDRVFRLLRLKSQSEEDLQTHPADVSLTINELDFNYRMNEYLYMRKIRI
jgi:lipid A disaccharide synthetase